MGTLARFPATCGVAELISREPLTPRMIRLVLRADDFGADWPKQSPGEILTLLFPEDGEEIVLPEQGWRFPDGVEQEWRNYTVRGHDPAARTITVDVVLHRPDGPASRGAATVPLRSPVGFAGPRVDYAPRDGAEWLLLCGDEATLPAIAAILESDKRPAHAFAVVEVADGGEELPVDDVRWVHRDGAAAATTTHLADALRELPLPDGPGQVWGAAESRVARDLRMVLREERGLPHKSVKATGYWLRSGDWLDDED